MKKRRYKNKSAEKAYVCELMNQHDMSVERYASRMFEKGVLIQCVTHLFQCQDAVSLNTQLQLLKVLASFGINNLGTDRRKVRQQMFEKYLYQGNASANDIQFPSTH